MRGKGVNLEVNMLNRVILPPSVGEEYMSQGIIIIFLAALGQEEKTDYPRKTDFERSWIQFCM